LLMATGTCLRKKRYGGSRFQQDLWMARGTTFASRLPSLGGLPPSLALCRRRIGCRWPARVRGVLVSSCFERFQAFEEGEHHTTHTHRGLVPIFSWYPQALWEGCGIKPIAHDAVSSCLVRPSLSQNI